MSRKSLEQKRKYGIAAAVIGILMAAFGIGTMIIADKEIAKLDQFILKEK